MPTMAIPSVYAMFSKLDCDEQSSSTVVLPLSCKSNRSWLDDTGNADHNISDFRFSI